MKGENDGQVWRSGAGSGHDHCCRTLEVNTGATERERDWGESPGFWFLFVSLDPAVTHTHRHTHKCLYAPGPNSPVHAGVKRLRNRRMWFQLLKAISEISVY